MFFFFSSRRRHTRSDRDWSSDVCSSDLVTPFSRRSAEKTVLRFLFWDAWRNGAWALAGRVEPWLVDALGGANWAILRWLHQWTLLHSPRPEILHAIERGDALLSHLDGEWWLSF